MGSYRTAHRNVQKARGFARDHLCPCGAVAQEWAYQFTAGDLELRDANGGVYSNNPEDYAAMCRPCHRKFDMEHDPRLVDSLSNGDKISEALTKRYEDPEFSAQMRNAHRRGRAAMGERMRADREFQEQYSAKSALGGQIVSQMRRRCDECGFTSTPGGIGNHQSRSGHTGWTAEREGY